MPCNVWVVGKWRSGEVLASVWDINGVFDSEEKAVAACGDNPDYFVGPLVLNQSAPDETTEWIGLYYPNAGGR
jgi:hypothetical protein